MRTLLIAALALMVSGAGADAWQKGQKERKPVTHTVTIEAMQFEPADLTVKAGDAIVWVNKDMFPHTATSTEKLFDSRQIDPGQSWTYRAVKKGTVPYICSLHPTMQGTLRVR